MRPNRREFLGLAAAGAGLGIGPSGPPAWKETWETLRLGVASYSLRGLSRRRAIEAILALRTRYVNIKSFHLPYESSAQEIAAARQEFESAGLEIVGGGTISLPEDNDDHIRRHFEYARAAGMPLMVIAPVPRVLPRIERFVREYDIKVAIHNHGPEDPYFRAPGDALRHILDRDPRVGLCVDVGHTARAGADVVKEIAQGRDRVLDVHMKDLRDFKDSNSYCVVGEGAMPVVGIFRQLIRNEYTGCVNLEHEIDEENPLPGMQRSFAYMRGVLDALG